jgi:hypothetical protein
MGGWLAGPAGGSEWGAFQEQAMIYLFASPTEFLEFVSRYLRLTIVGMEFQANMMQVGEMEHNPERFTIELRFELRKAGSKKEGDV